MGTRLSVSACRTGLVRALALLALAQLVCAVPAWAQRAYPLISKEARPALIKTNAVISYRTLTNSESTGNTTEYTTPAFTPSAGSVAVAAVVTSDTVQPDPHAISSLHGTWYQLTEISYDTTGTPLHRLSVWYCKPSATLSTLTNKFAGAATGCAMFIFEFNGADLRQDSGFSAFRQFASQSADATANPSLTMNGPMAADARNAAVAVFASDLNPFAGAAEASWTEDYDNGFATPTTGLYVAHRLATTDNSFSVTSASADEGLIIFEVRVEQ